MKKAGSLISLLFLLNIAAVPAYAEDQTGSYENLLYTKHEDYIEITGCSVPAAGEVTIPAEIDGLPVKAFGTSVFKDCTELTSVLLPEGMTDLGLGTFENCTSLSEIELPSGITEINSVVFWSCAALTEIGIPEGVTTIGEGTFYGTGLKTIIIPESVTSISAMAFMDSASLESITIKNPDCEIAENAINTGLNMTTYQYEFKGTVIGKENSTAQAYAEKTGSAFAVLEEEVVQPGDADLSGKVDILDVITINRAILGKEKLTERQLNAVDFNQNGKPETSESLMIMKYIVGLMTDFTS